MKQRKTERRPEGSRNEYLSLGAFFFLLLFFLSPVSASDFSAAPAGGEARYFTVTAYYSPLPGQSRYLRGNYHDEIILNGKGTNGADGTAVYSGMLAAPYTYSFGTKIFLPGMGVGTVHDRGGAIVSAGNRGYAHDRIDVWMGYGDAGLTRALSWGKRTVLGSMYSKGSSVTENFSYAGVWPSGNPVVRYAAAAATPKKGEKNTATLRLQKNLANLGYFNGLLSGYFGVETEQAILDFQLENNVIASPKNVGAGVYGPQTQKKLYAVLSQKEEKKRSETAHISRLIPVGLSVGTTGEQVKHLQNLLTNLSYFSEEITGKFDEKTEAAVLAFQLDYGVISSKTDGGAGVFGPKTQSTMLDLLHKRKETVTKEKGKLFAAKSFGGTPKTKPVVEKKSEPKASLNVEVIAKKFPDEQNEGVVVAGSSVKREAMSMSFGM